MASRQQPRWADAAPGYEAWYRTRRGQRYDALEKRLMSDLLGQPRGRRLLEIGCGSGHFTRWFGQMGWQTCGLDREIEMIRRARAHSREDIQYFRGDAEALPFRDHSFDVCALITTLESTAHPEQALREALRVSREIVLLGILNSLSPLALWRRIRAVLRPTIFSQTRFYAGPVICEMVRRIAREANVEVSVQMSSRWGNCLPLGAFYALGVTMRSG